jgi:hypothetical protein
VEQKQIQSLEKSTFGKSRAKLSISGFAPLFRKVDFF